MAKKTPELVFFYCDNLYCHYLPSINSGLYGGGLNVFRDNYFLLMCYVCRTDIMISSNFINIREFLYCLYTYYQFNVYYFYILTCSFRNHSRTVFSRLGYRQLMFNILRWILW